MERNSKHPDIQNTMTSSRAPAEYLDDLVLEASHADFAAIVVGYEEETRFVWSGSDDPAARLKALLCSGGRPFAILGADIVGNAFIYRLIPFREYEGETWMLPYLAAVGENVATTLAQRLTVARN
jgi:hypothetical protein